MANEISLSFPDTSYSISNKPSVETLKSDLSLVETGHNAHVGDADYHFLKSVLYPVGSIYINAAVSTNPATLLGFGTWVAFGAGKMIIGLDGTDPDFNSLSDTGGAKTSNALIAHTHTGPEHTHTGTTGAESANHSHSGTTSGESGHTHGPESGVTHYMMYDAENTNEVRGTLGSGERGRYSGSTGASSGHTHTMTTGGTSAAHTHSFTSAPAGTGVTGNAGSGSSFSIMNPYVIAYMWRRTA